MAAIARLRETVSLSAIPRLGTEYFDQYARQSPVESAATS